MKKTILNPGLILLISWLSLWSTVIQAQNINHPNIQAPAGLRVNSYTGNLFAQRNDFLITGEGLSIDITFSYNSFQDTLNRGFGRGWVFPYSMFYEEKGDSLLIYRMDGRSDAFLLKESGGYQAPIGIFDVLTKFDNNKFLLTSKEGMEYYFENPEHKQLTRIQDTNGNQITLSYNDSELTQIGNSSNRSLKLNWDNGLLSSIIDENINPVREVTYSYNEQGLLTKVTHPDGFSMMYEYTKAGRIKEVIDKNSNEVFITYNTSGQVQSLTSCLSVQKMLYNPEQGKTYLIEQGQSGEQMTIFSFDENGNLINQEGNCCGFKTNYEHDDDYNVSKQQDGNGNTTIFDYDNRGNLTTLTDPNGATLGFKYEPQFNRVTEAKDKNGNTTNYTYDSEGNLTRISQPLSITNEFTYDDQGNVKSTKDGQGNTTQMTYDSQGNLTQISYPIGSESYAYDSEGNLLNATDANGNTTRFSYDVLNRPTIIQDALNNQLTYEYDGNGNLSKETDPNNNAHEFGYDALNRLVSVNTPAGLTLYGYDQVGNLTAMVDANGHTNTYTYNNKNLVEIETDGAGFQTNYTYDENGNLITRIDANGNITTYEYDALDRLIKKSYEGNTDSYAYDNQSNLIACSNNDIEMEFTYDALNRLTSKTVVNWNKTISYTYDANSNRKTMTDPDGGITTYSYDANNRLTQIQNPQDEVTKFTYDDVGRITRQDNFNNSYTLYTYDTADRLLSLINYKSDGEIISSYEYTYDAKGNRLSMKTQEGTHQYSYDGVDRVTDVSLCKWHTRKLYL